LFWISNTQTTPSSPPEIANQSSLEKMHLLTLGLSNVKSDSYSDKSFKAPVEISISNRAILFPLAANIQFYV